MCIFCICVTIWNKCSINKYLPVDLCLNFSLFFFLHFQGLKRRPREANLLLQWMGAACDPDPRASAWMEASFSTSSAVEQHRLKLMHGNKQLHMIHPVQYFSDGTFCAISAPTAEAAEVGQIQSLLTHITHTTANHQHSSTLGSWENTRTQCDDLQWRRRSQGIYSSILIILTRVTHINQRGFNMTARLLMVWQHDLHWQSSTAHCKTAPLQSMKPKTPTSHPSLKYEKRELQAFRRCSLAAVSPQNASRYMVWRCVL